MVVCRHPRDSVRELLLWPIFIIGICCYLISNNIIGWNRTAVKLA
jgi:hypothetical protein